MKINKSEKLACTKIELFELIAKKYDHFKKYPNAKHFSSLTHSMLFFKETVINNLDDESNKFIDITFNFKKP